MADVQFKSLKRDLQNIKNALNKKMALYNLFIPQANAGGLFFVAVGVVAIGAVAAAVITKSSLANAEKDFQQQLKKTKADLGQFSCSTDDERKLQGEFKFKISGTTHSLNYTATSNDFTKQGTGRLEYGKVNKDTYMVTAGKVQNSLADRAAVLQLAEKAIACCMNKNCRESMESKTSRANASGQAEGVSAGASGQQ